MENVKAMMIMIGFAAACIGVVILSIIAVLVWDEIVGILKKATRTWKRARYRNLSKNNRS